MQTIVADLVCPNDPPTGFDDVTSEDKVHTMMDNCVDTCNYYEQDNCIVFEEKSKCNFLTSRITDIHIITFCSTRYVFYLS